MTRQIGMVGALCVATLALGAVAGSPALAGAPEFGRCVAKAGGKFANRGCTQVTAGKEKFEWLAGPGPKNHFTSKIKESTKATLETVNKEKVICGGETSSGEVANAKELAAVVVTFTGCESSGLACTSAGQSVGTVVTAALEGVLGVIKVGTKPPLNNTLGVELHPPAGQNFAEFTCVTVPFAVRGAVIQGVPANKMLLSTTVKLTASKGKQKPEKFEGGPLAILESAISGGPFEQTGLTLSYTTSAEEAIEASSVN